MHQDTWEALEGQPGSTGMVYRRLHPDSRHDLRAVLDLAQRTRMLVHDRDLTPGEQVPRMPASKVVRVRTELTRGGAGLRTIVVLADATFSDVFATLVDDVAAVMALQPDGDAATTALQARLQRWQQLLAAAADQGMSAAARRGLFGELHVLKEDVLPRTGPADAVRAWTGPLAANQDFQLPGCAVEVKTTSGKQPQALVVSNERELDDRATRRLFLLHLSIDERRGGAGMALNNLVDEIAELLQADAEAYGEFHSRLHRLGWGEGQREHYEEPRYALRRRSIFEVREGFPRITEEQLLPGVGDVRYKVAVSACLPYVITEQSYLSTIAGRPST